MTGFRTFIGETIIYQDGGVSTFELSETPTPGIGILTNRRFVHQLSPVFNPQVYFLTPNGIALSIPLNEVTNFSQQGSIILVSTPRRPNLRIEVRGEREWLKAWLKAFTELNGQTPIEVKPGVWQVRSPNITAD